MDIHLGLTLTKHDLDALGKITHGSLSEKVRIILDSIGAEEIKSYIETSRTTIRIDLPLAEKLNRISEELGVPATRIARAMVEAALHTAH